jgi:integrase
MFNIAIDSKLRGCDLVKLRVSDVYLGDSVRLRTTVLQQKTGRPVPFELTEPTREALVAWLRKRGFRSGDWLFPSRSHGGEHIRHGSTAGSSITGLLSRVSAAKDRLGGELREHLA